MRLLLAAKHPPGGARPFGGVQTWCETLARVWSTYCIETVFWGPELPLPKGRFDLGIFANIAHTAPALTVCREAINVSHGIIPDEKPDQRLKRLFTSEEVRRFWNLGGNIIRQPIDLDYWSPAEGPRDLLLFYSYRAPGMFGLDELADALGLRFAYVGSATPDEARDYMRRAALCCATGRAALEAMACGAPTLICDHRPYNDGPLVDPDIERQRARNYSGRGGIDPCTADLKSFAEKAMQGNPRAYVARHHDAKRVAEQFLTIIDS